MTIEELKTYKKILILGYGVEGKATERFLKKHLPNVEIGIADRSEGEGYVEKQAEYNLIIKSPGIHPDLVRKNYTTATNIFFANLKGKAIGITGTKGKSTTTSLIYQMLKKQEKDVYLVGNIGKPMLDILDTITVQSWCVVELSSFQLQDIHYSPHIAVLLMVTGEHLLATSNYSNFHKSIEEYVDAKRNILRFQNATDFAVINRDYPASNESDIYTEGKVFYVSRERETNNGCFAFGGKIVIRKNGQDQEIIATSEITLPGAHNLENVCAAVMAANLAGVSKQHIVEVLKTFTGLEHRLEFVKEINGVKYYDDSISTTAESAIAAIEAFSNPKVLILGGESAGSDFTDLGRVIAHDESIRGIIGVGKSWKEIKKAIQSVNPAKFMIEGATSMEQIVKAAHAIAQPGDVVLLSPACKSYDMFENYKDRGEQFKKEVKLLS